MPLETNYKNIVSYITKVEFIDSVYIVFSPASDNCVAIHDEKGRLKHSIRRMGRGPGEFNFIMDMQIGSNIYIYDRGKTTIQSYGFNGDYISNFKWIDYFSKFTMFNNYLITYHATDAPKQVNNIPLHHRVNVFDISSIKKPKLVFSDIDCKPYRQEYLRMNIYDNFHLKNNNLFYWTFPADTILNLNLTSLVRKPYILIDLGKNRITQSFLDKSWKDIMDFGRERRKRKLYSITNFYSLNKDVYYFGGVKFYLGFDLKLSNNLICYNKMQVFPVQSLPPISFNRKHDLIGSISNNKIIFAWQAYDFLNYCKKAKELSSSDNWEKILNQYPGLNKVLNEVTEDSNPVLMIATLK